MILSLSKHENLLTHTALKLSEFSLSQLPYLDTKHEYLWGNTLVSDIVNPISTLMNY